MGLATAQRARVVDPVLSNLLHGYCNGAFVGMAAFPAVKVGKREGLIITFDDSGITLLDTRRAIGANTTRFSSDYGSQKYKIFDDSIEYELPIELIQESQDLPLEYDKLAMMRSAYAVRLRLEFDQLSLLGNPLNYPATLRTTLVGVNQWSDPTSNIEQFMQVAMQAVFDTIGKYPNVGIASNNVLLAMIRHPLVRDKIKYTSAASITNDALARMFGLSALGVAGAAYRPQGAPLTAARIKMFANSFWLGYCPEMPESPLNSSTINQSGYMPSPDHDKAMPSFGKTYVLGEGDGLYAEQTYYEQNTKTYYYPTTATRAPVLTQIGGGYLFSNVSAT